MPKRIRSSSRAQFERANSTLAVGSAGVCWITGPLKEYQVKLSELKRTKADLDATLTPPNSKVIKAQAQIDELETNMEKERANVVKRIKNEYDAARRRQELLQSSYASQATLVAQKAGQNAHYNTLKFEVDTNRELYQSMLQKS